MLREGMQPEKFCESTCMLLREGVAPEKLVNTGISPPMAASSPPAPVMTVARQGAFAAAAAIAICAGLRLLRARVYDALIVNLTTEWYAQVLARLPKRASMLDVGVGTGLALVNNKPLVCAKELTVDGVDYDGDYVKRCRALVVQRQLSDAVRVHHASVYDFQGGPYDAVYFSASLMIMPDPAKALTHGASMLKPGGRVYVTQTIQTQRSRLVELGKPLLKFLTTIDFGQVTYEPDLLAAFKKAGLSVVEDVAISGSTKNSTRSYRLFVLQP